MRLAARESPYFSRPSNKEDVDDEISLGSSSSFDSNSDADADDKIESFMREEEEEEDYLDDEEDDDDTTSTAVILAGNGIRKRKKKQQTPLPPPDNVLLPLSELAECFGRMPCPKCYRKSLQVQAISKGCISNLVITCSCEVKCGHEEIVQTPYLHRRGEQQAPAASDGKYPQHPNKSTFRDYGMNYNLVLMVQLLGVGIDGLSIIFAFLGIASAKGNYTKWKEL